MNLKIIRLLFLIGIISLSLPGVFSDNSDNPAGDNAVNPGEENLTTGNETGNTPPADANETNKTKAVTIDDLLLHITAINNLASANAEKVAVLDIEMIIDDDGLTHVKEIMGIPVADYLFSINLGYGKDIGIYDISNLRKMFAYRNISLSDDARVLKKEGEWGIEDNETFYLMEIDGGWADIYLIKDAGKILVPDNILIPEGVLNSGSFSIFYELGSKKLLFEQKKSKGKTLITVSFPRLEKPEINQVITVEYDTYEFTRRDGITHTISFSNFPTTPDATVIKLKFPEKSSISLTYIPPTIAKAAMSGNNEITIRGIKIDAFNLSYDYELITKVVEDNDHEIPDITIKSVPPDGEITPGYVSFAYTAYDESGIKQCELILNNESRQVTDNVIEKDNEFLINLTEGNYIYAIKCTDNSKNNNSATTTQKTLTVIQPPDGDDTELFETIMSLLDSYGGISLLLAVVLVVYLIFASVRRMRKKPDETNAVEEKEGDGKTVKLPSEMGTIPEAGKETGERKTGGKKIAWEKTGGKEGSRAINPSIMKLMDKNETRIMEILLETGETTQANIYKITQIPKATLSDLMRKLENRNLIERRAEGRVKWVKIKDWVFE